jgi:alpha-beta hydrolase superfamily lysophospholipase
LPTESPSVHEAPPPETLVDSTTRAAAAADGTRILVRHWAVGGDPWASMLIVHGLGEHSGRYDRTGGLFAAAGIDATALDLRGHGGSGGRRGDVEQWTDFLDDIGAILATVRSSAAGRPVVLLGHSMGGLLSADYVLAGRTPPDVLVLSSPALDDGLPRWQHAVGPVLARAVPRLAMKNAWGPEVLSRDPEVGRRAREDPGCPQSATVRLGAFGFEAQARVRSNVARLDIPTLVFHGREDRLVPPRASEPFQGLPGVTRRVYAGLRHETLNEPEGPQIVADVVDWLRIATAPQRSEPAAG